MGRGIFAEADAPWPLRVKAYTRKDAPWPLRVKAHTRKSDVMCSYSAHSHKQTH